MSGRSDIGDGLRGLLLAIFVLGSVGTLAELLLMEHYEDFWQLLPLGLIGAALLALAAYGITRARLVMLLLRGLMIVMAASAVWGLMQHYQANMEFALETHPELRGGALLWEAIQGTAPPTLAPGAMVILGLAGLGYTHKHPALAARRPDTTTGGRSA